jgi:uncharacterized DUF497 family protein
MEHRIDWDPAKAASNLQKHGVSFDEGKEVLRDPLALVLADKTHADRFNAIGMSQSLRVLFVVHTTSEYETDETGEVTEVIRIIGARKATKHERRAYENTSDGADA